jgi:hypothetical protein
MTDSRRLDRALDAYLADGVNELADRVLEAALMEIDHTDQRRHLLASRRFRTMTMQMRLAGAALVAVLAAAGLFYILKPNQSVGPPATPSQPSSTLATLGSSPPVSPEAPQAAWTVVGAPTVDHNNNGNVIGLADGGVLAVGGSNPPSKIAEIYDPATGTWQATGSMSVGRSYAVAARLSDGRVLVAGGASVSGATLTTAEIWDPATGAWTSTGKLNVGRGQAFGTTLKDGRVLVGGGGNEASSRSVEIYDPASGSWSKTGSLLVGRASAQIPTVLSDGRVLVVGGFTADPREAELFDPVTGTWTATGRADTPKGDETTAVTLPDGRVLFFSGSPASGDIYDAAAGTWTPAPALAATHGDYLASTVLSDGRVLLVAGGQAGEAAAAEIFDPVASAWSSAGSTASAGDPGSPGGTVSASFIRAAVRLPDGSVLVIGASAAAGGVPLAEVYRPS